MCSAWKKMKHTDIITWPSNYPGLVLWHSWQRTQNGVIGGEGGCQLAMYDSHCRSVATWCPLCFLIAQYAGTDSLQPQATPRLGYEMAKVQRLTVSRQLTQLLPPQQGNEINRTQMALANQVPNPLVDGCRAMNGRGNRLMFRAVDLCVWHGLIIDIVS